MSLSRRMQILLDEDRQARLQRRAANRGSSVAALIREAIDVAFPPEEDEAARRRAAGERLLREPAPSGTEPQWEEVKEEMLDSHYDKLPACS